MYVRDEGVFLRGIARVLFVVPAAVAYFFVYIARRIRRWHICGAAQSWPTADAKVISSFQIDENQVAFSTNSWSDDDPLDENDDYSARWAVAIQYTYQIGDEHYSGDYFLPETYTAGDLAADAANAWTDKIITVRYKQSNPKKSFFLVEDGAPGKPHIPRLLSWKPQVTELSLK
jgi:hypothetical protein